MYLITCQIYGQSPMFIKRHENRFGRSLILYDCHQYKSRSLILYDCHQYNSRSLILYDCHQYMTAVHQAILSTFLINHNLH